MYIQCGKHVSRANTVNPDPSMRPFYRQTSRQVPDCSFGRIVRSLRLWHIYDASTHAPNHDNAAPRPPLHKVSCNTSSEEVGAINVDTPELLHTVVRVRNSVKVLGEASTGDKVVNPAMSTDDFGNGTVDTIRVGDVGKVGGYGRGSM